MARWALNIHPFKVVYRPVLMKWLMCNGQTLGRRSWNWSWGTSSMTMLNLCRSSLNGRKSCILGLKSSKWERGRGRSRSRSMPMTTTMTMTMTLSLSNWKGWKSSILGCQISKPQWSRVWSMWWRSTKRIIMIIICRNNHRMWGDDRKANMKQCLVHVQQADMVWGTVLLRTIQDVLITFILLGSYLQMLEGGGRGLIPANSGIRIEYRS